MINKLKNILIRYDELAELMSKPDAMQDMKKFTNLAKEHSSLTDIAEKANIYIKTYKQLQDDEEILNGDDLELKELVKDEIGPLKDSIAKQEEILKILLIPKDPKGNLPRLNSIKCCFNLLKQKLI